MAVAALVVSIVAALIAAASAWYYRAQARTASAAVEHARTSAEAATRSADLAEVVERGRHYGWRIEARTNEMPTRAYTLRNVGTIDARNVTLAGQYSDLSFHGGAKSVDVAAGQARLFVVTQFPGDQGGDIEITWTPALHDAEPKTWTETPPMGPPVPRP